MKLETAEKAFAIKVAFIGPKNSGKTTLINALLKDKYAPVGIGGATVSVNSFRISQSKSNDAGKNDDEGSAFSFDPSKYGADDLETLWSMIPDNLRTAGETVKVISDHNRIHQTSNEVQELTFDVELSEGLCDMRADTNLILIDIPGIKINESKCKYLSYLENKWESFDCVVFVLDVFQPLEDQISLLNIVKRNLASQMNEAPVIVVCNKVDDANNQEVASIFSQVEKFNNESDSAFVYRAASGLNFEQFQRLDLDSINQIGYNEVARLKWMALKTTEKYQIAFEAMSDGSLLEKFLVSTNFPSLLMAFRQAIGGEAMQSVLIKKQLNAALKHVKVLSGTTVASIRKIIGISDQFGIVTPSYRVHFWNAYKKYTEDSIHMYKNEMDYKSLYLAMSQLIEFDAVLVRDSANGIDHQIVLNEMISLLRVQINVLLKHASSMSTCCMDGDCYYGSENRVWYILQNDVFFPQTTFRRGQPVEICDKRHQPPKNCECHWRHVTSGLWQNVYTNEVKESLNNPVSGRNVWYGLSPMDFKIAINSILLLSYNEAFCLNFGPEKIRMESFLKDYGNSHFDQSLLISESAGEYDEDGNFIPCNKDVYELFVHFVMPHHISNQNHWGHLAWMFCKFMDSKRP